MTIRQLQQSVQPVAHSMWQQKPVSEKLLGMLVFGLAMIAAGNSGYQWLAQEVT